MIVYLVIEHDPYLPKDGFSDHAISVCKTEEKAKRIAEQYDREFAPYYHTVERCEVIE